METRMTNKSWKLVYEVTMMEDLQVVRSEMFDTKDEALDALYSWALAVKAAGRLNVLRALKDKRGVYGYNIALRGHRCHVCTRMETRVVEA